MQRDTLKSYEVLGLEPGASSETVRKAYLELVHTWDPQRHIHNPVLFVETQKKRAEIEAAYQALQAFLPDLNPARAPNPEGRFARDFQEMSVQPKADWTKAILGLMAAAVLALVILAAVYLYDRGAHLTPAPVPVESIVQE